MRVLVAMSGGVDSSVAAALMIEAGHEVVGVTLKQWIGPDGRLPTAGCCTVADAADAASVAARLGIRHYVLDRVEEFREAVVAPFVAGYAAGRTPNPCVECNRRVRFGVLLDQVEALGCEALATGHYARIEEREGRLRLLAARDRSKDQSYVLHMLAGADLARLRFPLGGMTKGDVRALASRLGLRTAAKPDSQDLCFVAGDHRAFLRTQGVADRPGPVVDRDGRVVGAHDGVSGFTVGQRRGLGVAVGEARYVVAVDAATAVVQIGRRQDLGTASLFAAPVRFVGAAPEEGGAVTVKVRYRARPVPATLHREGEGWRVRFAVPEEAVAPGQSAVFYRGDEVLGGGIIVSTEAA